MMRKQSIYLYIKKYLNPPPTLQEIENSNNIPHLNNNQNNKNKRRYSMYNAQKYPTYTQRKNLVNRREKNE